jgi:hypothetical protein
VPKSNPAPLIVIKDALLQSSFIGWAKELPLNTIKKTIDIVKKRKKAGIFDVFIIKN